MNLKKVDGKWIVDIQDVRGKRLRRGFPTKAEAEIALSILRNQRTMSRLGIEVPEARSHNLLFADFAEKVIAGQGDLRENTKRGNRYCLNAILSSPLFQGKRLGEITTEDIASYHADRGNEPTAANAGLCFLKMIFRRAVEWGELTRNPATPVKYSRVPATKLRILTDAEAALLLNAAQPTLLPVLRVLITTGARPHEIFALYWEYDGWDTEKRRSKAVVDLARKVISIPHDLSKNHKDREVPLSPELAEMFKGLRRDSTSDKVFPWVKCPDAFSAAVRAAGLKNVTLYTLKHTAASRMIRAGVDIVTVSEILGHSDIKMTMIYCHSDGQSKREAVERVSRIYFQPPKVADAPAAATQPDHQTEGMVS